MHTDSNIFLKTKHKGKQRVEISHVNNKYPAFIVRNVSQKIREPHILVWELATAMTRRIPAQDWHLLT